MASGCKAPAVLDRVMTAVMLPGGLRATGIGIWSTSIAPVARMQNHNARSASELPDVPLDSVRRIMWHRDKAFSLRDRRVSEPSPASICFRNVRPSQFRHHRFANDARTAGRHASPPRRGSAISQMKSLLVTRAARSSPGGFPVAPHCSTITFQPAPSRQISRTCCLKPADDPGCAYPNAWARPRSPAPRATA